MGIKVDVTAETAEGELIAEIRSSLDGSALATSSVKIDQVGTKSYYLSLSNSVDISANVPYYVVLKSLNSSNAYWEFDPTGSNTLGSFVLEGVDWANSNLLFHLTPVMNKAQVLSIGGSKEASQEIKTISSETITAIDIDIQKNIQANGELIGALYKKTSDGLQYVDQSIVNISNKHDIDAIRFEFGLPLEKIEDASTNYVLTVSAPALKEGSISWLGIDTIDNLETKQNGVIVSGEASYTAYKSDIKLISTEQQVDANYSVVLAWCRFVEEAKKSVI